MLGKAYGSDGDVRYVSADWRLSSPLVPGLSRTFRMYIATVFTSTDTASDISVYTLIMWTRLSSPFADAASGFPCRAKGIFSARFSYVAATDGVIIELLELSHR